MVDLNLFYQHFIEGDQRLAGFVFFFLIPTSQSLLSEQALTSQLLWESLLLTELSGSCKWLISMRRVWDLCVCVYVC